MTKRWQFWTAQWGATALLIAGAWIVIDPAGVRSEPAPAAESPSASAASSVQHRTPSRIRVTDWQRSARVVPLTATPERELIPPDDVRTVGVWADGAMPDSGQGTVVLTSHRDSAVQGPGFFAELEHLPAGSSVELGGRPYRLARTTVYNKTELPAGSIFRQSGPERLAVVTCGGDFHPGEGWDSNVVSIFKPVTN